MELTESTEQQSKATELIENEPENSTEISYAPVPPKRTVQVRMRFQFKGRGKPLPYRIDEE